MEYCCRPLPTNSFCSTSNEQCHEAKTLFLEAVDNQDWLGQSSSWGLTETVVTLEDWTSPLIHQTHPSLYVQQDCSSVVLAITWFFRCLWASVCCCQRPLMVVSKSLSYPLKRRLPDKKAYYSSLRALQCTSCSADTQHLTHCQHPLVVDSCVDKQHHCSQLDGVKPPTSEDVCWKHNQEHSLVDWCREFITSMLLLRSTSATIRIPCQLENVAFYSSWKRMTWCITRWQS